MRSADVQRVFRDGRPIHGRLVVVFLGPGSGEVAFVAGRKVGSAVQRNRARRILRAAFRDVAPEGIAGRDALVVAREAIRGARTQDLVSELSGLLETEAAR